MDLVDENVNQTYSIYDIESKTWTEVPTDKVVFKDRNYYLDESLFTLDKEYYFRANIGPSALDGSNFDYGRIKIMPAETDSPVEEPIDEPIKEPEYANPINMEFILFDYGNTVINKVERHTKYITGYPNGDAKPDGELTRTEAAMMIYRLLNIKENDDVNIQYNDVHQADWYYEAINGLSTKGFLNGYEDKTFKPNNPITRAEFTKIISFIKKESVGNIGISLNDIEGHWAYLKIIEAISTGVIDGYPNGSFRPENNITRAEAAKILNIVFKGCH